MRRIIHTIFLLVAVFFCSKSFSQITVTTGQSANQLAQKLVGSGVTISAVTLTSTATQSGKFTATSNAFPFTDGIVLTTGRASTVGSLRGVNGPNQSGVVSNSLGTAGDAWLNLLLPPSTPVGVVSQDACILEFDLIPNGDSIFFNYIFSSEEYTAYVCSNFNDVFGFRLSGPGIINYKNIALVPNQATNIPVSVNSVNNGVSSVPGNINICKGTGVGAPFPAYYQANGGNAYMTHFGRTVKLVAKAAVTRCVKYHLKLAIADVGDGALDSGVFLEAGSLNSTAPATLNIENAYTDSNKQVLVERCHPLGYVKVNRNLKVDTTKALTLNFTYSGTATYNVDYTAKTQLVFPPYKTVDSFAVNVIDDGLGDNNETIIIKMQQSGCTGVADSIPLKIIEFWSKDRNLDTTICYKSNNTIKSFYADSSQTTFLWNSGATTGFITPDSSGKYIVTATFNNSCLQKDTFDVIVDTFLVNNIVKNYSSCNTDSVALSYTTSQPAISHLWSTGSTDSIIKVNAAGNYVMSCTSVNGCKATDTSFIKYILPAIPTLPPTANFCVGDSVLLTANNDLGLKYKWSNGDTTNAIWVKTSGTYSVIIIANGCPDIYDTTVVTAKPYPSTNLPTNIKKCKGDSVWLNASSLAGSTYSWSNGLATDSILVTTSGQYRVEINLNGCFAKDTSNIIFYDVPVLNLPSAINFCAGDSSLLNATTFAGTQYLWSTADTSSTIWVKANGTYFVKAILGVCNAYDSTIVSVTQYPTLNLQTNISSCLGDSVKLDATNATGTIYSWNNGATSPILWIKNTGTYIVDASLNGCSTKDTSIAVFNKTPVLNLAATKNICAGDSVFLDATTFAGTQYLWSTGATTSSIYANANATYSVKANLGVCNAYDSTIVSVIQYPTLNLQTNISSCLGDSVKLDATNAAGTIYTWNNGATSPTLWIKTSGTYIVAASLNSCETKDTTIAAFNKTPVLNLPATRDTCQGKTVLLDATTFAGTNYTWSTGETTPSINLNTAGTYSVKATLGVCDAFDTTVVSITQYPTLNLQTNISSCLGDSVKLDATNAAGTIYTWNNGATSPTLWIKTSGTYIVTASLNSCATKDTTIAVFNKKPLLNLPSSRDTCQGKTVLLDATTFAGTSYTWSTSQTSSSINVNTAGTYFVKATLGVCDAFDTTVVTITQYPALSLQANIASCKGDSVLLDATNTLGTIYTWSNGASSPTVWIKNSGTYTVIANLNSCITKDTSTIIFYNIPQINLPPTIGFCDGDSATLNATSNIAASSYLWNTNAVTNLITVKTAGTYLVDVKANGCTTRDTTVVSVYPLPFVDAGLDLFVFKNQQVTINAIASNDAINFAWKPSFNLSSANILKPTILSPVDTTYKILVTTANGCSAVDFVKVTVLTDFVIPNVFSPNGDGQNDTWAMKGIENYPGLRVDIFDRYGRKVLSSLGYRKPWNGNLDNYGKPVPVGVYYYIIDMKNGNPPITGSLTLLR